ncbi:MAG: sulfotransferase [Flavobacteriales bacterium]|nr:sulfotransferase [Flavobacteriales bacterium]
MHQMLAAHPHVAAMEKEELTVFSRYLSPWATNFELETRNKDEGKWSQGLPCLFTKDEFEQQMRSFVETVYGRLLERRPASTHILDKHPNYSNHIPLIDQLLPRSRFLHIIRDGREVAVSMMSVRKRVGHSPGEVRGAAQEWHRCLTNARACGTPLGPERYMEVRYEDLRKNTDEGLQRILEFCGLSAIDGFSAQVAKEHDINVRQVSTGDTDLNALRNQPDRLAGEMSITERYIFDRMAGGLLRELGYAEKGWWAIRSRDRLQMLPYGFMVRAKRSVMALQNIWSQPVEKPLL